MLNPLFTRNRITLRSTRSSKLSCLVRIPRVTLTSIANDTFMAKIPIWPGSIPDPRAWPRITARAERPQLPPPGHTSSGSYKCPEQIASLCFFLLRFLPICCMLATYSFHRGARGIPSHLRCFLTGFVDFTVGFLAGVSRCSNQIIYGTLRPRQPRIVLNPDSESLHQATYV